MKLKLWLNIITFGAVGLVVFFAWSDIIAALDQIWKLDLWVLSLIVVAQFIAFFAIAKVYSHFFKAIDQPIKLRELISVAIELNFVNHVFPSGGVSGFSYLALRLKHDGVSAAKSTLAQLVRFVFTFSSFIVLLIAAIIFLAIEDKVNSFIILIATAITVSIIFGAIGVIFVIGSKERIASFSHGAAKILNKIIHFFRRKYPETIRLTKVEKTFLELHDDYHVLKGDLGKMGAAFGWALVANIAEVTSVYIAFIAHGTWVDPGAVIIAYAVATIAGLLAILPGGLGIYEPLMAAVLASAGVPAGIAVSATLVSRVIILAVALSTGYVLYHLALRHYARHSS
ncbi:MAG: lysylphosphatidylglycerol synthase transmembrane domain-containing protein [Candidatus Woesebacteria bacterium]|jgi:uncharacterized protein (TIRG00374 family)